MLFDNNIEPCCSYCRFSNALGRGEYACEKQGIMHGHGHCGSYRYEPTKRVPRVMPGIDSSGFSEEDFTL